MKRLVFAVSALMVVVSAGSFAKVVDRTIAKVNGDVIFLSDFEKNFEAVIELQKRVVVKKDQTKEWIKENKKSVLKQMIEDKLLLQEAKIRKVKVNKRDMEEGIKQIKSRFTRDAEGNLLSKKEADRLFREELKKEGLSEKDFEKRIRDQYSVVKLIDQEVKAKIAKPADTELKEAFDRTVKLMKNKKVDGLTEEEAVRYNALSKYFNEKVAERVSARHILIKVEKDASQGDKNKALKQINNIRAKVKKGADFGELAEKYSDDTESAKRGGFLGAFIKGWMVPEFENAAFALGVGEVSGIVKTEYGYHIIKVEEKKAAQALRFDNAEIQKDLNEFVYQLKAKKKYDYWLESLTKQANIDILDAELK